MAFGHEKAPRHEDDIEAGTADQSSSDGFGGHTLDESDKGLGEYELLDRFITRGGHAPQEEAQEVHEHVPWWKFWKSSEQLDDTPQSNKPPPEWLEADIRQGISSADVTERRRRFGYNELVAEKENQLAKFMSFFQGPILYGECIEMHLASIPMIFEPNVLTQVAAQLWNLLPCLRSVLRIGLISV